MNSAPAAPSTSSVLHQQQQQIPHFRSAFPHSGYQNPIRLHHLQQQQQLPYRHQADSGQAPVYDAAPTYGRVPPPPFMASAQRNDSLLAMRKHRSLDGGQFLAQFDNPSTSAYTGAGGMAPPKYPPTHRPMAGVAAGGGYMPPPPPPPMSAHYGDAMLSPQMYDYYGASGGDTSVSKFPPYGVGSGPYYGEESMYLNPQGPSSSYDPRQRDDDYDVQRMNALLGGKGTGAPQSSMPFPTGGYAGGGPPPPCFSAPAGVTGGGGGTGIKGADFGAHDYEMLKRECVTLNQKLNYVMNSIRTFWSPELKKERQLRKEEALRISSLQYKLSQQAAEIQRVRNELEKREKDIGQLLAESDLGEMEAELRRLRAQIRAGGAAGPAGGEHPPRDFTDKTPTMHELQTARAKMERSELALAEKARELAACEVRLKCAEEQNAELEKRVDILTRSNAANEAQMKLLHDDLDVLRRKLETKNQQIENRDRSLKAQEKELETCKTQIQQHLHTIQENERQISQLTHRIDQLETLLRERDALADRLKQRLAQSPDTRAEAELQQRLENAERDKNALQAAIDELRRTSDAEKQNQLQVFQEETRQLRATIANLQKELADRHVLIVSQNEKISQLDAELGTHPSHPNQQHHYFDVGNPASTTGNSSEANGTTTAHSDTAGAMPSMAFTLSGAGMNQNPTSTASQQQQSEVDEARNEIGRLLSIVRQLESEKSALVARLNSGKSGDTSADAAPIAGASTTRTVDVNAILSKRLVRDLADGDITVMSPNNAEKTENKALRLRIDALEEALRESVGITSERDKLIGEQKQLIQQLSNQVAELFKSCGGKDLQKLLQDALKRAESAERALREERTHSQRQIASLRKEVIMAVIREKDACIQLLHGPPDSIRDKLDVLRSQREQLKHRLLAISDAPVSLQLTAGNGTTTSIQGNFGETNAADAPPAYGVAPTKAMSAIELNTLYSAPPSARQPAHGYSVHRAPPTFTTFQPDGVQPQNYAGGGPPSMAPINIAVPPMYGPTGTLGLSAPASFSYGRSDGIDDEGIWA